MKTLSIVIGTVFCAASIFADTLILNRGEPMSGTVLQTNGDEVLFANAYSTMHFALTSIKEIRLERRAVSTNRIPNMQTLLELVSKQPWATNLEQIPATVIGTGMLKYVPYASFRAAGDFEINVYGDLANPAGVEIGVYRALLTNAAAKKNCLELMSAAMTRLADIEELIALDPQKDRKVADGLTFEITPPTDPDAYGGWWVSIYDEKKIDKSRASEEEIKRICVAKSDIANGTNQASGWSGVDLSKSRPYHQMVEYHPANPAYATSYVPADSGSAGYVSSYSGGGSVYVHGYTRKDGTYVNSYTRSAPRR